MSENKKVIIWTRDINKLLLGEKFFGGGTTIQLYFWAKTFLANGWDVYSFSTSSCQIINGLKFKKVCSRKKASLFFDLFSAIYFLFRIRPDVIITRGASRTIGYLSAYTSLSKTKLVFMGASDVNFIPGKENVSGLIHNRKLYQYGLKNVRYFLVQNEFQKLTLEKTYNKKSIIVPNIWATESNYTSFTKTKNDVLWVSNFRALKRPMWFINLAKRIPNQVFIMVGAPIDKNLYFTAKQEASKVKNLVFKGGVSFDKANELFEQIKVFVCTSEYEGFPNTFLQAWSNNIPVVSTVDPSNVIQRYNLGIFVKSERELLGATLRLLNDPILYQKMQESIKQYFENNHNCKIQFNKLIAHLYSK